MPPYRVHRRSPADRRVRGEGGLRALLWHRAMVQLCVLGFVLFFACYGQFESGLAAYGTEAAGIEPSTLGFALAANTAVDRRRAVRRAAARRAAAAQPGDRGRSG